MSYSKVKRYTYILRKAFMLPVGFLIVLIGLGFAVYFLPDIEQASNELNRQKNALVNSAEQILANHPEWPLSLKEKLIEFKRDIQVDDFSQASTLGHKLLLDERCYSNRKIFFLSNDSDTIVYADQYRNGLLQYLVIGVVIIVIGGGFVLFGSHQAKKVGKYISSKQLMENVSKIEMPQFPSKDFLTKMGVKEIRVFIVVNRFGRVVDVDLLAGPKVAFPYIVRAIRKWKFDPFMYKGKDTSVFGELVIHVGKH